MIQNGGEEHQPHEEDDDEDIVELVPNQGVQIYEIEEAEEEHQIDEIVPIHQAEENGQDDHEDFFEEGNGTMYMQELEMNELFNLCSIFPNATGDIPHDAEPNDGDDMRSIYEVHTESNANEGKTTCKCKYSKDDEDMEPRKQVFREKGEVSGTSPHNITQIQDTMGLKPPDST